MQYRGGGSNWGDKLMEKLTGTSWAETECRRRPASSVAAEARAERSEGGGRAGTEGDEPTGGSRRDGRALGAWSFGCGRTAVAGAGQVRAESLFLWPFRWD
jgi:hypothetical protein